VALATGSAASVAAEKPSELQIGISTYPSGSASVFGVPGKDAADSLIADLNAKGGIGGVPIRATIIDEGGGGERLLSDYRRLADSGINVMLSAISSGHCGIVAPVAEDLKVLNILWDCGTQNALEEKELKYVVRTQANATTEMVAQVLYLQALRPDVILSTSWGGDLDNFVRQASQRNLFNNSTFVLSLAESSLERLGNALPEGVIIGARGDHYWQHPETKDNADHKEFVKKFHDKTGAYPIYPTYHMAQALAGLKAGYEKAIEANGGKWPTTEQVAEAMHNITYKALAARSHSIAPMDRPGKHSFSVSRLPRPITPSKCSRTS